MISQSDLSRVASEERDGTFIADDPTLPSRAVRLETLLPAGDGHISEPALADLHGGLVPAEAKEDGNEGYRTRDGWIAATFTSSDAAPKNLIRGVVRLSAEPVSPAGLAWRQIARVLVREQGF